MLICALARMSFMGGLSGQKIHFIMKLTQIMSLSSQCHPEKKFFFQFLMSLPQQGHKLLRMLVGSVWK